MHTLPFSQIHKNDVLKVGGKGASLGEMSNALVPVPPGFVVTSNAFFRFLDETDLDAEVMAQIDRANFKSIESINKTSALLRALFREARMPDDIAKEIMHSYRQLSSRTKSRDFMVAVRSSATAEDSSAASWAGELETYLNTTEADLLENVKKCWSSVFTPRALMYGCEQGLYRNQQKVKSKLATCPVGVAVVVQQMVQSEISGVAFTVHPVTEDRNQLIIEAGWGLGEAIVSGQITPDSYIIDKRDWSIVDITVNEQEKKLQRTIGNRQAASNKSKKLANEWTTISPKDKQRQKLSGKEIIELAQLCVKIEKHYGFPCDIEWAYIREQGARSRERRGKFFITQSRPITTLKK